MSVQNEIAVRQDFFHRDGFVKWPEQGIEFHQFNASFILSNDLFIGPNFRETEFIVRVGMQLLAGRMPNQCPAKQAGLDGYIDSFVLIDFLLYEIK